MLSKVTLPTAVALATFASAVTTEFGTGISIPLRKRGSLTRDDGVFDLSKATFAIANVKNKYSQNLIDLVQNGHGDAQILPVAEPPATAISKRQQEDLTDHNGTEWAGTITIGSDNQEFSVIFDTGSADFWVPSSACRITACQSKRKYQASSSNTSSKQEGTAKVRYADGSFASGPIYTDTVTAAGISVSNQSFLAVTTIGSSFGRQQIDGLMGLAYPSKSSINQLPFFNNAFKSRAVSSNVFAFKLASTGSSLFLGGKDSSLFRGCFETHNVNTSTGYWQISNASAMVGNKIALSGLETIIDSGTSFIIGVPSAVQKFYEAIPGSSKYDIGVPGFFGYQYPCRQAPDVAFNWGRKNWKLSEANFNLGKTREDSGQCVGAVMGLDHGLGSNVWILGDSFMKNVYTAFDFDYNQVGFATLA